MTAPDTSASGAEPVEEIDEERLYDGLGAGDAALARMAVRFGYISPAALSGALNAWRGADGDRSLHEFLSSRQLIGPEQLEMLSQILAAGSGGAEPAVAARPRPGTVLGDFRILRQLARGSMGVVYEAVQESLDRPVALKVLPSELTRDDRVIERFRREAGAAASLNHPGIVKILSVGEENGYHFYAMDMVHGKSLDKIVDTERIPFRRAAEIIAEAADALDVAHQQGVVHRDIKPGNVMVTREGRVLLTDFGLARMETTGTLTRMDEIVGTPIYMSPEQARGDRESVDAASDIYSLGATLYEALTLYPPFEGTDIHQILSQVIGQDPRPPRAINPLIPKDLETICLKAMEKDKDRRYSSARALADDLGRFLKGDPIHARPPSRLQRFARKARRNKPATTLLAVGLLAALVSLTVLAVLQIAEHRTILETVAEASRWREKGAEAFRAKVESLDALARIEAEMGRTQESKVKSDLVRTIRALQSEEDRYYEKALAGYDRVLRLSPRNREANEGIAWITLHKALTEFHNERSLGEASNPVFSKVRERIATIRRHDLASRFRERIDEMLEYIDREGLLSLDSIPSGARIKIATIDRENDFDVGPFEVAGTTPLTTRMAPGSYMVRLEKEGFLPCRFPVTLTRRHPKPAVGPVELLPSGEVPEGLAYVPVGEFLFGGRVPGAQREQWVQLPAFFIDIREISFEDYLAFLNAAEEVWTMDPLRPEAPGVSFEFDYETNQFTVPSGWDNLRRLSAWGIPWEGARRYCVWRTRLSREHARETGAKRYLHYRLPTEQEWEKAARGCDGRRFPWGDAFDERKCNNEYGKRELGSTTLIDPSGSYPEGASPYGVLDMAGNVAEWTATLDSTGREVVVKGGDVYNDALFLSSPARRQEPPRSPRVIGFRVLAEFRTLD